MKLKAFGGDEPEGHNERADHSDGDLVALAKARLADDAATAERVEVEWAATSWRSLLHPTSGPVELSVVNGMTVVGEIEDVGAGWCIVAADAGAVLVMLDNVLSVRGIGTAVPPAVAQRGVGWVLRRWAAMRASVAVHVVNGDLVRGRLAAVLGDAVNVLTETEPTERCVLPMSAVATVTGPTFFDQE